MAGLPMGVKDKWISFTFFRDDIHSLYSITRIWVYS